MPTYEFFCKRCDGTTIYSNRHEVKDVSDYVCPECEVPDMALTNFDAVENLTLTSIVHELEDISKRIEKLEGEFGVEDVPTAKGH